MAGISTPKQATQFSRLWIVATGAFGLGAAAAIFVPAGGGEGEAPVSFASIQAEAEARIAKIPPPSDEFGFEIDVLGTAERIAMGAGIDVDMTPAPEEIEARIEGKQLVTDPLTGEQITQAELESRQAAQAAGIETVEPGETGPPSKLKYLGAVGVGERKLALLAAGVIQAFVAEGATTSIAVNIATAIDVEVHEVRDDEVELTENGFRRTLKLAPRGGLVAVAKSAASGDQMDPTAVTAAGVPSFEPMTPAERAAQRARAVSTTPASRELSEDEWPAYLGPPPADPIERQIVIERGRLRPPRPDANDYVRPDGTPDQEAYYKAQNEWFQEVRELDREIRERFGRAGRGVERDGRGQSREGPP